MTIRDATENYIALKRSLGMVFNAEARVLRSFARALGWLSLEEVSREARLVADCLPGATLFLQPIADERSGGSGVGHPRLFASLSAASAENTRSMFRPQLHKLMGIR